MEQDQLLRRDQPLSAATAPVALLIAAHGEKTPGATNESVMRIAGAIRDRGIVSEVALGLINGEPTIRDGLNGLSARRVIIYPLFASNGYFTRDRLVQLIEEAGGQQRQIEFLAPLGLDPGLTELVVDLIARTANEAGLTAAFVTAILLAHGSRRNPASREATEWIAGELAKRAVCGGIATAFLEEQPHLDDIAASLRGPAIVVGMFSGEGLHGARDAPRLVARLQRPDIVYAGVIGDAPGIEKVVGAAVVSALRQRGEGGCVSP